MSLWEILQGHLQKPEYLHVLLNPLPVYGVALGIVALILAIILRSRRAQIVALILLFISAASAWPVAEFGEQSYDILKSRSDDIGAHWLDAHGQRATRALPAFYALAALALAAAGAPWKYPKCSTPLNVLTLLLSIAVLGLGIWIAFAGGQVRHKEFRFPENAVPSESLGGYEKMER